MGIGSANSTTTATEYVGTHKQTFDLQLPGEN